MSASKNVVNGKPMVFSHIKDLTLLCCWIVTSGRPTARIRLHIKLDTLIKACGKTSDAAVALWRSRIGNRRTDLHTISTAPLWDFHLLVVTKIDGAVLA
jgi:hypothetical protein